jgi:hypothetical protein
LLALVKFLDLIGFRKSFEEHYVSPKRVPKLGGYAMVSGMLMLLFIGFQRMWHFTYIRSDAMLCGILRVKVLPAASTFWRYLRSLTVIQSQSLLRLGAVLRKRVWALCEYRPKRVTVNIDTTVSTVYGDIEGAKIGYNKKHRGKKGLRPVLCFLAETREYLCGRQRRGKSMSTEEVGKEIRQIRSMLPDHVEQIRLHGDGEFIGWKSVKACIDEQKPAEEKPVPQIVMPDHTIRIARLKMLFVAAKIRFHGNRNEVRYSIHENRAAGIIDFLEYLDRRRKEEGLAA